MSGDGDTAEKQAWIARVLGIHLTGADSGDELAYLKETLAYIANALPDLADSPDEPDFAQRLTAARALYKTKDVAKTMLVVESLRADIVKAVGQARVAEAAAVSRGAVARATLALDISAAHQAALANLDAMGAKLVALPGVKEDPRFPVVQKALKKLARLIPPLDKSLQETLERYDAATTRDARHAVGVEAVASLKNYQAALLANPVLQRLEMFAQTELGSEIAQDFRAVLDETATELRAA
jgi:hypothetical protein